VPAKAGFFDALVFQAVALCQFRNCAAPSQAIEPSIERDEARKRDILAPAWAFSVVFCNEMP